jgi:hypothetical protein
VRKKAVAERAREREREREREVPEKRAVDVRKVRSL